MFKYIRVPFKSFNLLFSIVFVIGLMNNPFDKN